MAREKIPENSDDLLESLHKEFGAKRMLAIQMKVLWDLKQLDRCNLLLKRNVLITCINVIINHRSLLIMPNPNEMMRFWNEMSRFWNGKLRFWNSMCVSMS